MEQKFSLALILLLTVFLTACSDEKGNKDSNNPPTGGTGGETLHPPNPMPPQGAGGTGGDSVDNPNPDLGGTGGDGELDNSVGGASGEEGVDPTGSLCLDNAPNGELDDGEECDDGNNQNRDGCNTNCQSEPIDISEGGIKENDFETEGQRTSRLHRYTASVQSLRRLNLRTSNGVNCPGERLGIRLFRIEESGQLELALRPNFSSIQQGEAPNCTHINIELGPGQYELTVTSEIVQDYDLTIVWTELLEQGAACDFEAEGSACTQGLACRRTPEGQHLCLEPGCGDGVVDRTYDFDLQRSKENCEDGNLVDGDGCSSECLLEGIYIPLQSGTYPWGEAQNEDQTFYFEIPVVRDIKYYASFKFSGPGGKCPDQNNINSIILKKFEPDNRFVNGYRKVTYAQKTKPNACPDTLTFLDTENNEDERTGFLSSGRYEISVGSTNLQAAQVPLFLEVRFVNVTQRNRALGSLGNPCDENEINRACNFETQCVELEEFNGNENWRCISECWDRSIPEEGPWSVSDQCEPSSDNCDAFCTFESYAMGNTSLQTQSNVSLHFQNGRASIRSQMVEAESQDQYTFFANEDDTLKVLTDNFTGESSPALRLSHIELRPFQPPGQPFPVQIPVEVAEEGIVDPITGMRTFNIAHSTNYTLRISNESAEDFLRYDLFISLFRQGLQAGNHFRQLHQGMTEVFLLDFSDENNATTLYTKLDCDNDPSPIAPHSPSIELVEVADAWLDQFTPLENPEVHFEFSSLKAFCERFKMFSLPPGKYEFRVHTQAPGNNEDPVLLQYNLQFGLPNCGEGAIEEGQQCNTPGNGNCDNACSTFNHQVNSSDVTWQNALPANIGATDSYVIKARAHYAYFTVKIRELTADPSEIRLWASYDPQGNNRIENTTTDPNLAYPNLTGFVETQGALPNLMEDVYIQVQTTNGRAIPYYWIEIDSAMRFKDTACNWDLVDFVVHGGVGVFDARCPVRQPIQYHDEIRDLQNDFETSPLQDKVRFELQAFPGIDGTERTQNVNLRLIERNAFAVRNFKFVSLRRIATRIYARERRGELTNRFDFENTFIGNRQNIQVENLPRGIYEVIIRATNPGNGPQTMPYTLEYLVETND